MFISFRLISGQVLPPCVVGKYAWLTYDYLPEASISDYKSGDTIAQYRRCGIFNAQIRVCIVFVAVNSRVYPKQYPI